MKVNGAKITEIRESQGWSKEFLADRAGISRQALESWEAGNVAKFTTLSRIADLLGVEESELLEGDTI